MSWTAKDSKGQTICKSCGFNIRKQPTCDNPAHYNIYLKHASKQGKIKYRNLHKLRTLFERLKQEYETNSTKRADFEYRYIQGENYHTILYWVKYFTPEKLYFYKMHGYPSITVKDVIKMTEYKGELLPGDLALSSDGKLACYSRIRSALEYLELNGYLFKTQLHGGRFIYTLNDLYPYTYDFPTIQLKLEV